MVGCLQVVRIYSFMKEIKVFISASYIVFLFKTENNFINEIEHGLRALITDDVTQHKKSFSEGWK